MRVLQLVRIGVASSLAGVLLGLLVLGFSLPTAAQGSLGAPLSSVPAPTRLRVTEFFTAGFELAWTPITLTAPGGRYQWRVAERNDGPVVASGVTATWSKRRRRCPGCCRVALM